MEVPHEKKVFIILCVILWLVNSILLGGFNKGLGFSIGSILFWSVAGFVIIHIGLFFYNIYKPDNKKALSFWGKASTGLIAGIILRVFGWTSI